MSDERAFNTQNRDFWLIKTINSIESLYRRCHRIIKINNKISVESAELYESNNSELYAELRGLLAVVDDVKCRLENQYGQLVIGSSKIAPHGGTRSTWRPELGGLGSETPETERSEGSDAKMP